MDPPVNEIAPSQKIEGVKEGSPLLHCGLYDSEVVHKTAQLFLPGLATACVDNTTGLPFTGPASLASDIRKEMMGYLTQRSETFVAETLIQEPAPDVIISDHPTDIIADFVDDFALSKRNFFSRVSGWLLSEKREDKIDDFVQEMEINRFWLMDRREALAQILLKNVDYKSTFHCGMKFDTEEELDRHRNQCIYRTMNCTNEGCNARFCAVHMEKHDSVCPCKILQCEQKCSASLARREMDRHCITVCPMKLVNCPFYPVGCHSTIPLCTIELHCSEFLHSHLLYILQVIHKEASTEDVIHRLDQLEQSSPPFDELCDTEDLRFLTRIVKELDKNMGPLEHITPSTESEEHTEIPTTPKHVTEESEIQVQTPQEPGSDESEAQIKVQASQEINNYKSEAGVQVKNSEEASIDNLETDILVKTCREIVSDISEAETQVQTSQEPVSDKLEAGIQVQGVEEPMSDESEEEVQVPTPKEIAGDKSEAVILAQATQERVSDESEAAIQLQALEEPISDEIAAEIQVHTSQEPINDESEAEILEQTSQEPINDELEANIQEPISDKSELVIHAQTSQEPVSRESEAAIQLQALEEIQVHTSQEAINDESGAEMEEAISDNSKAEVQVEPSQDIVNDYSESEGQLQNSQEPTIDKSEL